MRKNNRKETIQIKTWIRTSAICLSILSAIIGYTNLVYESGVSNQIEKTAIEKEAKFNILLEDLKAKGIDLNEKEISLNDLVLADYLEVKNNQLIIYKIHRIDPNNHSVDAIGTIASINREENEEIRKRRIKKYNILKELIDNIINISLETNNYLFSVEKVYAQVEFDWNGYENKRNFHEKYINKNTVRRYYNDGAILEYKVAPNGSSIPKTFKWIKLN